MFRLTGKSVSVYTTVGGSGGMVISGRVVEEDERGLLIATDEGSYFIVYTGPGVSVKLREVKQ